MGLEISDDGALSFQTRRGEWCEGTLLGSRFVSPYLTILNIGIEGKFFARHVVIMPDTVHAEDFTRLRVRLRWGGYLRLMFVRNHVLRALLNCWGPGAARMAPLLRIQV